MTLPAIQLLQRPVLDARPVARRLGLIALATDHTSERDFTRMVPPHRAGTYVTRIAYANPVTPATLGAMAGGLADAAALILPDEPLDALYFACTAASVEIGDAAVEAALRRAKPGVTVVTPTSAALGAFKELGMRRLSILTPYREATTRSLAGHFAANGMDVRSIACFGLDDDREMARVRPDEILRAAVEAMAADADGLFISCTALRSAEVAERIEARIGRPVVTSNQAGVWRSLRLAGIESRVPGHGRLLRL
jgi:maleate isomerase